MSSPRPSRAPALLLLALFVVAGLVPLVDPGQAQGLAYCPQGDGENTAPTPSTAKAHRDLTIGDTDMVLVPSGGGDEVPGDERGRYTVLPFAGTLNVTVSVTEIGGLGTADSGQTTLRATLGRPDGSTMVRTATIDVPGANGNTNHTFQFTVGLGRHTVTFHVNPNQSPAEDCRDGVPNGNCPDGGTMGCAQTYYNNNRHTVGVLAGNLPDLHLVGVAQDGPDRATPEPGTDSEATFSLTVANDGATTAFNLSALNPGASPMTARVAVRDCDCAPQTVEIDQIAVGATKTVTTDPFALHGLTGEIVLDITLDPDDWVAELNEADNQQNRTLPLPTPDLVTTITADLPREGNAFVTPQGRDLTFSVTVSNEGLAPARTVEGGDFVLTVHQDGGDATPLLETNLTLDALGSAVYTVTAPADNVTGEHTFTVRADPADDVFESSDTNNDATVRIVVAVYEATVTVPADAQRTTVPPGVTGRIPFTLQNTGSVTDTYDFSAPPGERSRQRYLDGDGNTITVITLAPGKSFTGEVAFDINATDEKDTEFDTRIIATSRVVHTRHSADITYVVGPDTLAPDISLENPKSGYLTGDQLVIRIRDNVGVTTAETDLGTNGAFVAIEPGTTGGLLYTVNATGQPQEFSFRVRATDAAGNTATQQLSIIRDQTAPRITNHRFTPATGARPGDLVNLIVTAEDENMDRVEVSIFQQRPGLDYQANFTLQFGGGNWLLREWVVPERPGYYQVNMTAYDRAGNEATQATRYTVQGLNLRIVTGRPTISPSVPAEGQPVTFTYVIENTSPRFGTGPFFVVFGLDADRFIGIRTLDLGPGERTAVQFSWIATPGPHDWTLVVDQAREVYEDNEDDNLLRLGQQVLFPDQPLFASPDETLALEGFGARIERFWFVPLLMVTVAVLFTIAFVLGRRPLV